MRSLTGDIWDYVGAGWIVIPTNMMVNDSGAASMGRGIAAQARDRFPGLDSLYGEFLRFSRYQPQVFTVFTSGLPIYGGLILLPTKRDYRSDAKMDFIEAGCQALALLPIKGNIYLPFLGIGYGKLDPRIVREVMDKYLADDRFVLVERGQTVTEKYPDSFREARVKGYYDRSLEKK